MKHILIIDNYDSFTYNLAQLFQIAGAQVTVKLNDKITLDEVRTLAPNGVVISPGPGSPDVPADVGVSTEIVRELHTEPPILGVCLGHQLIGHLFGGQITRQEPMHGMSEEIRVLQSEPLFAGMPETFGGMRYHSLVVARDSVPAELIVTAETTDGLIMGMQHNTAPLYSVQFHPESIGTPAGQQIVKNFIRLL